MAVPSWQREFVRRLRRPSGRKITCPHIPPVLLTLAVAFLVAASVISLLETKLRPVVIEVAAAQAKNTMTVAIEKAVTDNLTDPQVNYGDFVSIQRNENGSISALTTDVVQLNLLRARLTAAVLETLHETDVSVIQVPFGSLFDLEPLWAKGPALKAQVLAVGTVQAEFDSQLTSAGVNQTLHRIWLDVSVPITLLFPGGEAEVCLETRMCVAETVIVGQVPDTYFQLDSAFKSQKGNVY